MHKIRPGKFDLVEIMVTKRKLVAKCMVKLYMGKTWPKFQNKDLIMIK